MSCLDLREALPADVLAALRGAYDASALNGIFVGYTIARYPPCAAFAEGIGQTVYPADTSNPALALHPITRELILTSVLLAQRGRPFEIATHAYLALMEGASIDTVAAATLLTGTYGGIPCLSDGQGILATTFTVLGELTAYDTVTVLGALRKAFG
jgi:alkylhydroperoxidase/carboxymuconolactone decarboxylase family protein YurZ